MYCMESYYDGKAVTNAGMCSTDEILLTVKENDSANKLVIFNFETKVETVIVQPEDATYFLDMARIPGNPGEAPYFIVHQGTGLLLINTEKHRHY